MFRCPSSRGIRIGIQKVFYVCLKLVLIDHASFFSKIRLKTDRREVGRKLLGSVSPPSLKTGTIFACFSLAGKNPLSTEMLMRIDRGVAMICRAQFNRRVGQEYSPTDLFDGILIISN